MRVINILDEKTINKIAAGEVVERPLSIVKELIENSIDSGATEITIEVKKDPLRFIRIIDNGCGLYREDLENAFIRHATSKIKSINDVECIRSLGFRGEALSSIAAISKVEMITKTKESSIGQRILLEGGKLIEKSESGSPNGTIITIRDVFFNTPARLKFLKSLSRELSAITDLVEKIALSNMFISIRYKIDDKLVFLTTGKGDLKGVIRTIFGKKVFENIVLINEEDEFFKITGYIGNSTITKGNRSHQIIFVNGRIIKSPLISSAVEKAYKSMLPINKFPFFVIDIEVNPRFIDVNIHPTKAEIKFQDEQLLYKNIYRCIKNHIQDKFNIEEVLEGEVYKENVNYIQGQINYEATNIKETPTDNTNYNTVLKDYSNESPKNFDTLDKNKCSKDYISPPKDKRIQNNTVNEEEYIKKDSIYTFEKDKMISQPNNKIPNLRVLGQVNSTYIIAEGDSSMFIIDQHAAHERIYYEKYMREFNEFSIKSQPLLVPIVENLSISEKQLLLSNIDSFKRIGFTIDDFGAASIAIREVPILYGNPDPKDIFNEILEDISSSKDKKITSSIDKVIYSMACLSSVKAGDSLKEEEIDKLIESLNKCKSPYTCPHGRPTIIKMTYKELEKKFKRIQ